MGRAAARSRAGRARGGARRSSRRRSCSTPTCSGSPPTSGAEARDACEIGVFGDFPFMVSGDSADVWARQQDFRLDASVGAPPDAFSETGQDWGFPAYRWDVDRGRRLRLARGARPAQRRALRRLPRRSSRRVLPHLRARGERRGGVRAAGRARSDRPGRSACSTSSSATGRADHRRGSRRHPRRSCARRSTGSRSRATRCCAGSATGTRRASRSRIPLSTRRAASRPAARTTPRPIGGVVGRGPDRGAPRRWPRSIATVRPDPRSRRAVQRRHARRDPAAPLPLRLRHRPAADPGRVRMEGSDQHAGPDPRRQLDLAAAVAGREPGDGAAAASAPRSSAGWRRNTSAPSRNRPSLDTGRTDRTDPVTYQPRITRIDTDQCSSRIRSLALELCSFRL